MQFVLSIWNNRQVLFSLVYSDFKNRYLGNHFGIIWAFFQPLVMIAVYWFVFTHGFRNGPVSNIPFLPWLLTGIIPWFLLSDAITSSSRAIVDQVFLVKKIVFEVKLLPLVKIGSALLVNIIFWGLLLLCLIAYGFYPSIYWLQIIYYLLCSLAFILSFSLLLSSLMVFMLDVGQMVAILMQIMFWATPIFWNASFLPNKFLWIIKLNPFAYIIIGMREALLFNLPFWIHYKGTLYFWGLTLALFVIGNYTFNKLKGHFADVL